MPIQAGYHIAGQAAERLSKTNNHPQIATNLQHFRASQGLMTTSVDSAAGNEGAIPLKEPVDLMYRKTLLVPCQQLADLRDDSEIHPRPINAE